jgi:translation initiation factor IF-1
MNEQFQLQIKENIHAVAKTTNRSRKNKVKMFPFVYVALVKEVKFH